jgi:hypothetical protein
MTSLRTSTSWLSSAIPDVAIASLTIIANTPKPWPAAWRTAKPMLARRSTSALKLQVVLPSVPCAHTTKLSSSPCAHTTKLSSSINAIFDDVSRTSTTLQADLAINRPCGARARARAAIHARDWAFFILPAYLSTRMFTTALSVSTPWLDHGRRPTVWRVHPLVGGPATTLSRVATVMHGRNTVRTMPAVPCTAPHPNGPLSARTRLGSLPCYTCRHRIQVRPPPLACSSGRLAR